MNARSAACLVFIAASGLGIAQPIKGFWERQYRRMDRLLESKRVKDYEALLDPHFVYVDYEGKHHSRRMFVQGELDVAAHASKIRSHTKILSLTQSGDSVNVVFRWRFAVSTKGSGGRSELKGWSDGVDTWDRTEGKWLLKRQTIRAFKDLGSHKA